MPQLTGRFGPIQQQVVLDGSGNGQVTFQPNGSNARITNLFVKVNPVPPATSPTNQAQCFMYKGQVSDSTILQNTNSGSTGAAAQGSIDLTDGEILYVVWTGGDAGATATATFVGNTIPFDQIGSSNIMWDDPIAAGDGSLVYPQVRSPNYVTGVSGWILRRDGSVEFGNAIIRGEFTAGGGTVRLNSGGLHIEGVSTQYDINISAGFLARNNPDDGTTSQINPNLINTTGQLVVGGNAFFSGSVIDQVSTLAYSPTQCFQAIVGVTAGQTLATSGSVNYPVAYPVGANVMGVANLRDVAANARHWRAQFIPSTRTQFQLLLTNDLAAGAPDARNLTFDVMVFKF